MSYRNNCIDSANCQLKSVDPSCICLGWRGKDMPFGPEKSRVGYGLLPKWWCSLWSAFCGMQLWSGTSIVLLGLIWSIKPVQSFLFHGVVHLPSLWIVVGQWQSLEDGWFFREKVVNWNLERTIFQETLNQSNHLGWYPNGIEHCTDNPMVGNVNCLTKVEEAQVNIVSVIDELGNHSDCTTEIFKQERPVIKPSWESCRKCCLWRCIVIVRGLSWRTFL